MNYLALIASLMTIAGLAQASGRYHAEVKQPVFIPHLLPHRDAGHQLKLAMFEASNDLLQARPLIKINPLQLIDTDIHDEEFQANQHHLNSWNTNTDQTCGEKQAQKDSLHADLWFPRTSSAQNVPELNALETIYLTKNIISAASRWLLI
ncbi:hypothetical protein BATDEDRAFT_25599 [Batrachochytrium dendrobatidis JAM81]|uniref:Uncharacterized protein n=2 Tax=Batrachochytrium dendrobatidis TaxID=109871 RepID=F4P518_BATDJ|nr:uncharacterized protein BATDEDRAFT_25599 [Batrachochytrium dendrobatidis JAM81]EGF79796.1 hypothetical protein BATDEDRAFT_25599 [Batrachochytrium dendrobatidis JAM81]KAJ8325049.1 hypothetical protein O5D80_006557 [Batrachochytrium dendrobatidis]KAK5672833.1 hypothetical protein QVD99_000323 [Batrachochytrium dendrobatidis]OAJ39027.1 hypothetical protein BDEG_22906 [Batrachochytrium dendrobatidis JEL423]|eukprot:XP_006679487.1 hypothetical protein BATDEDRAFT_25599 [Batrachochytrium dendrobatidis JAM81]